MSEQDVQLKWTVDHGRFLYCGETNMGQLAESDLAERVAACLNWCEGIATSELQIHLEHLNPNLRTAMAMINELTVVLEKANHRMEPMANLIHKVAAAAPFVVAAVQQAVETFAHLNNEKKEASNG